jgi:hypothetical protein
MHGAFLLLLLAATTRVCFSQANSVKPTTVIADAKVYFFL